MKLLHFAFVVHFIIACWPKIDIIGKILVHANLFPATVG